MLNAEEGLPTGEPIRRLAVVEDDPDLQKVLRILLSRHGFQVVAFGDAAAAWAYYSNLDLPAPDLWIIDIMLPGLWNGLDLLREMRAFPHRPPVPVLLLTARGAEADVVKGLAWGADDYVVKPYRPRELVARIRALLRRYEDQHRPPKAAHQWGPVVWDPGAGTLRVESQTVQLTLRENEIFRVLVEGRGRLFQRYEILERLGLADDRTHLRSVDVHILHIRRKLGRYGMWLVSVRGMGYAWRPPPDPGGAGAAEPE